METSLRLSRARKILAARRGGTPTLGEENERFLGLPGLQYNKPI